MVTQIRTWYVITTKDNLSIKAHFLDPWSFNPYAHVTTFACQLDRRQVECKYRGVTITNNDKVDHFVAQMYACGLFEAKFLDDWEDTANKSLGGTHPHFTWQFNKDMRKLELNQSQKNYESSSVFCGDPHPHTLQIPQGGATDTTTDISFTEEMEYNAALGEKANAQTECIIELEASVDVQTVLTDTTNYLASVVVTSTNKKLNNIRAMTKQLAYSVTAQVVTMEPSPPILTEALVALKKP